ncbi:uncharacterized protein LOC130934630 [Arachis stenosperma]|uniref:uncharacterized protein LOC130934630 n=1 Tax=Arachis stenosperma TaxID=217475 RepID=UPI0025AD34E6|nr:uncharacterized protein LOC130934630 [Arachis stenosperma]
MRRFYAVRKGRKLGIYTNWDDCAKQVLGFNNNEHKSFYSLDEAEEYMKGGGHAVFVTEVKDFLYEKDMELMLMRVCSSLRIGFPMFVPQHLESKDGQPMFGFIVFLPHNPRGMELVAHGLASTKERIARQEVSFTMLEKLLANTGYEIYDYNYRKLVLM